MEKWSELVRVLVSWQVTPTAGPYCDFLVPQRRYCICIVQRTLVVDDGDEGDVEVRIEEVVELRKGRRENCVMPGPQVGIEIISATFAPGRLMIC